MSAAPTRPPPMKPPPARPAEVARTNGNYEFDAPAAPRGIVAPTIILPGVEGVGKTTTAAYAPDPIITMTRDETGYQTLYDAGRVPQAPTKRVTTFDELLGFVDSLCANPRGRKTFVLDALGGAERLCHEKVCARDFGGDWGEKGFTAFQRGYDTAVSDWLQLIARFDKLRATHNMTILILSHVKIETFKNPEGPDYDRYVADCHRKTWSVTHKWADAVLFANFVTVTQEKKGRVKGIGGQQRVIHTERHASYDAKNRFGLVGDIDLSNDETKNWETIWNAITGATS